MLLRYVEMQGHAIVYFLLLFEVIPAWPLVLTMVNVLILKNLYSLCFLFHHFSSKYPDDWSRLGICLSQMCVCLWSCLQADLCTRVAQIVLMEMLLYSGQYSKQWLNTALLWCSALFNPAALSFSPVVLYFMTSAEVESEASLVDPVIISSKFLQDELDLKLGGGR